ncbi:TetR/AcrR family transcriptional regulator [Pseudoalteromonas aurantia]|uniref:TetR/AcrR family transcriptional regulator n=1 Tax=Pseudoalteromonas aurantia TaxID=43654 RepID=UPI00110BA0A0|nr:TetR/AcrR family transcriptional regulator [Pseudoalteromonas aurantia]TMO58085.1 TetR/AcrR family transcriptional regulator [Pseudoalteromonas aurantia]
MRKGKQTRQQILETALNIATGSSLNDLTIGSLAAATEMSKSGLFAHFKSKENLQLAVLEYAHKVFRERVIEPQSNNEDPFDRLLKTVELWLEWYGQQAQSCIYISATTEFDDQPGPVRDKLKRDLTLLLSFLENLVTHTIEKGDLKHDTDAKHFVFEFYSLYLGSQQMKWVDFEDSDQTHFWRAFDNLINRYRKDKS